MPIIEVHLFKGHTPEVRTRVINAMTDAFRMVVPAPPASITVLLHELERENYMRGGAKRRPARARQEPVSIVMTYIAAVARKDFDAANAMLADRCEYNLPGGTVVHSPAELVAWAAKRSRDVRFVISSTETSVGDNGPVVHLRGEMSGEWLDGSPFDGVRLSIRYEFEGDRICKMDLWNDLAEAAARRGGFGAVTPDAAPDTDSADR